MNWNGQKWSFKIDIKYIVTDSGTNIFQPNVEGRFETLVRQHSDLWFNFLLFILSCKKTAELKCLQNVVYFNVRTVFDSFLGSPAVFIEVTAKLLF